MTAASSIRASNAGNYNLHLALHTNASGEDQAGQNRGSSPSISREVPGECGLPSS